MAGKKLPKNVDFAAGFFSSSDSTGDAAESVTEKITAPTSMVEKPAEKEDPTKQKNLGGRPRKDGLKNEQFTLTMNPETYEKLRIVAEEHASGNFSRLIDDAIKAYCKEKGINLAEIKVDPQILDMYRQKQDNKRKKK